jgi:hypothetical protein
LVNTSTLVPNGFYVQGTPPPQLTGGADGVADRGELLAEAAGWHRDAYSHHKMWNSGTAGWERRLENGTQPFTPPLAAHMLCYLQDMDGPGGPLMAVPGSHRSDFGDHRTRSHCRFVPPLIHFIPYSLAYSVPLFLKR